MRFKPFLQSTSAWEALLGEGYNAHLYAYSIRTRRGRQKPTIFLISAVKADPSVVSGLRPLTRLEQDDWPSRIPNQYQ